MEELRLNTRETCPQCSWVMRERECETCNLISCPNTLCGNHLAVIHTDDSIHFQCVHDRKICLNCIESPDVTETPVIYFCRSCGNYKCAQCNLPTSVYPLKVQLETSTYDETTQADQYQWDLNERLQDLAKEPFLCPPCFYRFDNPTLDAD